MPSAVYSAPATVLLFWLPGFLPLLPGRLLKGEILSFTPTILPACYRAEAQGMLLNYNRHYSFKPGTFKKLFPYTNSLIPLNNDPTKQIIVIVIKVSVLYSSCPSRLIGEKITA